MTIIFTSREAELGPRVKTIAEESAYRTEGKSLVVCRLIGGVFIIKQ